MCPVNKATPPRNENTQPREGLRCTSETADVVVPGLTLLEGFVAEQEEAALLRQFVHGDDVRWTGPLKRRVQHFG